MSTAQYRMPPPNRLRKFSVKFLRAIRQATCVKGAAAHTWRCTKRLKVPTPKSQKPAITRAPGHFLLVGAGQCRASHHSHSIVAGGLLDTS